MTACLDVHGPEYILRLKSEGSRFSSRAHSFNCDWGKVHTVHEGKCKKAALSPAVWSEWSELQNLHVALCLE